MGIHDGHRQRVREKLLRQGTDAFHTHELLEAALFYAIPYKDTNPTAHLLIETAGSLSSALALPIEEVEGIHGCGEHVAVFLSLLAEAARRASYDSESHPAYDTHEMLAKMALSLMQGEMREVTYAVFFDNRFAPLGKMLVFDGYYASAGFRPALIAEPALKYSASMVALISNHPNRGARADVYERDTSEAIRKALASVGVKLLEHLIVAGSVVAPALESPMERTMHTYRYHRFCAETTTFEEEVEP